MTDFTFYTGTYLAGKEAVIDAASFLYWERSASQEVRTYTFGNINESAEIPEAVQLCVCEVAECLYNQDKRDTGITSEKVGDYSVSYQSKSSTDKTKEVFQIINKYLSNTGLMYCGVT